MHSSPGFLRQDKTAWPSASWREGTSVSRTVSLLGVTPDSGVDGWASLLALTLLQLKQKLAGTTFKIQRKDKRRCLKITLSLWRAHVSLHWTWPQIIIICGSWEGKSYRKCLLSLLLLTWRRALCFPGQEWPCNTGRENPFPSSCLLATLLLPGLRWLKPLGLCSTQIFWFDSSRHHCGFKALPGGSDCSQIWETLCSILSWFISTISPSAAFSPL